jgi:hypothetical protein
VRIDWVPYSASALVVGASALSVGALLSPRTDDTRRLVTLVQDSPDQWMAMVGLYLVSSVGLVLGLPSVLSLFERRGSRTALVAVAVFTVGCLGTVAYAVLLAVYRAMVIEEQLTSSIEELARQADLIPVLVVWVATFLLGEVLLGIALLLARAVPRWIPIVILVHAALALFSQAMPQALATVVSLLITVGLAGLGIYASQTRPRVR